MMQKKIFDLKKSLNLFPLPLLLLLFSGACSHSYERVAIELNIPQWADKWLYYHVIEAKGNEFSDSIQVRNDGGCEVDLKVNSPHVFAFTLDKRIYPLLLVVSPGERVRVSLSSEHEWNVEGSLESSRLIGFQNKLLRTERELVQLESMFLDSLAPGKKDSILRVNARISDSLANSLRSDAYWYVGSNPYDVSSVFVLVSILRNNSLLPYDTYKSLYHKVDSCMAVLYPEGTLSRYMKQIIGYMEYEDSLNRIEQAVGLGSMLLPKQFTTHDGKLLQVPGIWAKWVLIDFWSPLDKSSGYERVQLRELYKRFNPKGLVVVSVGFGMDSAEVALRAVTDSLVWYQVARPELGSIADFKDWGIARLPANLLIDRNGRVLAKNISCAGMGNLIDSTMRVTVAKSPVKINPTIE